MKKSRTLEKLVGHSTSSSSTSSSSEQFSDIEVKGDQKTFFSVNNSMLQLWLIHCNHDYPLQSQEAGVDLLAIRAMNPIKYSLALMDALFSDQEMGSNCFSRGRRGTKQELPQEKVKLIQGYNSSYNILLPPQRPLIKSMVLEPMSRTNMKSINDATRNASMFSTN